MSAIYRNLPGVAILLVAFAIGLGAVTAAAQEPEKDKMTTKLTSTKERTFCGGNNWSHNGRESVSELREVTIPATGTITVDGRQNGGINIKGDDRSDVHIRTCIQAWGATDEEAKSLASHVKIRTGSTVTAENSASENNWSVSYEILVPIATNLDLRAHNGGIAVTGAEGNISFDTTNGGVYLNGVAGTVKGRTSNGGITVVLSGKNWKGSGLDVQTTNGGVSVSVPDNFAAHIEASTTNGGFSSDFPSLQPQKSDDERRWDRSAKVTADLNGGGATVRIMTTNGGVRIKRLARE